MSVALRAGVVVLVHYSSKMSCVVTHRFILTLYLLCDILFTALNGHIVWNQGCLYAFF